MKRLALALSLGLAGCHRADPEAVLRSYAQALREGRVAEAYRLTAQAPEDPAAERAFLARYQDPAQRALSAEQILAALPALRLTNPVADLVLQQGGWKVVDRSEQERARQALTAFLTAAEAGQFEAAYGWLSTSWKARYTPARLASDFVRDPSARDRLARARAALSGPVTVTSSGVEFPVGENRAVRLLREAGAYRVAALE